MKMNRENLQLYSSKAAVPTRTSNRQTKNFIGNSRNESIKKGLRSVSAHSSWPMRKLQTNAQERRESLGKSENQGRLEN